MHYTRDRRAHLGRTKWWRFDRYEIRGGYICPAPDARLEAYDPWSEYVPRKGTVYRSLFTLLDTLHMDWRGGPQAPWAHLVVAPDEGRQVWMPIREDDYPALLRWCGAHGLLGLLLQRVRAVVFWPQWQRSARLGPPPPGTVMRQPGLSRRDRVRAVSRARFDQLMPRLRVFLRGCDGWVKHEQETQASRDQVVEEGTPAAREWWARGWPRPRVVLDPYFLELDATGLEALGLEPVSLRDAWAPFFPDVPTEHAETYAYPAPLTAAFWRAYAEPVGEFLAFAQTLRRAWEALALPRPTHAEVSEPVIKARGAAMLHRLVAGVAPALERNTDGSFRGTLPAPSLLASFAAMVREDVAVVGRLHHCDHCKSAFLPAGPRGRYCSDRCRRTMDQAHYREGKRAKIARRLREARVPTRQAQAIARTLGRAFTSVPKLEEAVRRGDSKVTRALGGVPRDRRAAAKKLLRGAQSTPNAPKRAHAKP